MKYLLLAMILFMTVSGGGCLESALEYPKTNENSATETETTVDVIGIIRSIDQATSELELETADGLIENVVLDSQAVVTIDGLSDKATTDLNQNSLAEIFGTRDPTSLIITARTVRAEDVTRIKIVSPVANAITTSPVIINGFVKTSDEKIYWRVKDQNNAVQLSGFNAVSGIAGGYSSFTSEIFLPALEATNFSLEIFVKEKNTEVDLQTVSLNLLSTEKSEFDIFFSNDRLNTTRACDIVFPATRVVAQTSAVGRAALLEILNGPSDAERYDDYRSSLPPGTAVSTFVINRGIATVTVSKNFNSLGACEKQRATEQIRQTLLGIGLVDDVVIEVE
jgi:hypothetical protein